MRQIRLSCETACCNWRDREEIRAFLPEQRPRRCLLLDFGPTGPELQQDLALMTRDFSPPERAAGGNLK